MEREPALFRLLVTALATRQFLSPDGGELPRWAEKAMETLDSPSLRILACLTPPWNQFEIDQYLRRCGDELGWPIPADELLLNLDAVREGYQPLARAEEDIRAEARKLLAP